MHHALGVLCCLPLAGVLSFGARLDNMAVWSSLPSELMARIACFAPRDGSALRWCSACHLFRAAQPKVTVLLLGDFASIVGNPLMQRSILSVDVLHELVVNLPAACADAAYTRLEALPSHVLNRLTHLFIAARLRPSSNLAEYLTLKVFKPLPRLRTLHIQNSDFGAEDAAQARSCSYEYTCIVCLEIVQALVLAGQTGGAQHVDLSIDIPLSTQAQAAMELETVSMWWKPVLIWKAGRWVNHNPAEELVELITRSLVLETFALNLGCYDPISFRPTMQAILDRWCGKLPKPPRLEAYKRRDLENETTLPEEYSEDEFELESD